MTDSEKFSAWMNEVERLGIQERLFDAADIASRHGTRRPYRGTDGLWYELWQSDMTPQQALGEALVEQDDY